MSRNFILSLWMEPSDVTLNLFYYIDTVTQESTEFSTRTFVYSTMLPTGPYPLSFMDNKKDEKS